MTAVIADTDILSTFGKIGRIDLLLLLFHKVYVASAVYHELLQSGTIAMPQTLPHPRPCSAPADPSDPTAGSTEDYGRPRL